MFKRKAVFLDRDGTLIKEIHRPGFPPGKDEKKEITAPFTFDELEFVPDVYLLMDRLKRWGFLRIMVTNQPDVAHGYMEESEWQKIQTRVENMVGLDGVYMCRHRTQDECDRKKPSDKMLRDAADNLGIDLPRSWMVGDTVADMQSGRMAGCGTILIDKFYNQGVESDWRVADLASAVKIIRFLDLLQS